MTLFSAKPRLWSRSEYYRLAEMGFFENERVELLRGEVVEMSPQDPLHAGAVENANNTLSSLFGTEFSVRVQLPLSAMKESEPEPDLLLLKSSDASSFRKNRTHPNTGQLVVEVARTSLNYDRFEKGSLYAQIGIQEYWIINLEDFVLEVFIEPGAAPDNPFGYSYGRKKTITPGERYRFMNKDIPVNMLFDGLLDS